MFDSTLNPLWQRYILAVQEEVKPALGCTEPISLALAAAVAAAELEGPVERVEAWVSPNLMKNGLGVTVPGTGMVGLPIAAALGALGGNANAGLEVLKLGRDEKGAGVALEGLARVGEADGLSYPVEEGSAKLCFQLCDLGRHRRLRVTQLPRSAGKAVQLGDVEESVDISQLHCSPSGVSSGRCR